MKKKTKSIFDFGATSLSNAPENELVRKEEKILKKEMSLAVKDENTLVKTERPYLIKEESNFLEFPIADYSHRLSEKNKGKSFVTWIKGEISFDIGSMYGALLPKGADIFLDIIPRFLSQRGKLLVLKMGEKDALKELGWEIHWDSCYRLNQYIKIIYALHIAYNKFIIKERKGRKTITKKINVDSRPIFLRGIFDKEKRIYFAVFNPLFPTNYFKILSRKILIGLKDSRSKLAYRYIDKRMGKFSTEYIENEDSLMKHFAITSKNFTRRRTQFAKCIVDLQKGYECVGYRFKARFIKKNNCWGFSKYSAIKR